MLLAAFVVFTLFDIAYVVFQDRWSFPKQFPEYDDYRQSTPFYYRTSGAYGNASGHGAERETVRMKFEEN